MSFGILPCWSSYNRRIGEHTDSIFKFLYGNKIPLLCYNGITADQLFHRRTLFMVEERCLNGMFFDLRYYPSMDRLINRDSIVTQLWDLITLRSPEEGGNMFSETSALTTATRYNDPDGVYHWYLRDSYHRRQCSWTKHSIPLWRGWSTVTAQ
jgi:hypothetical protein